MSWRGIRAAIVAVIAIAIVTSGCSASKHTAHGTAAAPTTSASAPTLTPAQVIELENGLSSGKAPDVEAVLADAARRSYRAKPWTMLAPGSKLTIDNVLTVSGALASVSATVSGRESRAWKLLLVREHGTWRVYGTRPA